MKGHWTEEQDYMGFYKCSECGYTVGIKSKYCPECGSSMSEPDDQTAKADSGKPKLTLVPRAIIYAIAYVRMYGCKKYKDPDNWRRVSVERYRDAAYRHFMAYLDDPHGTDTESGLPHLWHCVTNFAFLCDLEQDEVIKRIEGSMKE